MTRMIVTDAIVYTALMFVWQIAFRGKRREYDNMRTSQEMVAVMYRQVLTWVGTPCAPMLPLISVLVGNYLLGVEFYFVNRIFKPPTHPWSAYRIVASFMGPSRAKSASRSLRRALLTLTVNPGSLDRYGKRTYEQVTCGLRQEERGPEFHPKT